MKAVVAVVGWLVVAVILFKAFTYLSFFLAIIATFIILGKGLK